VSRACYRRLHIRHCWNATVWRQLLGQQLPGWRPTVELQGLSSLIYDSVSSVVWRVDTVHVGLHVLFANVYVYTILLARHDYRQSCRKSLLEFLIVFVDNTRSLSKSIVIADKPLLTSHTHTNK